MKAYVRWLTLILLLPQFAQAAPVTVTNPGFESNVLADGFFTVGILTGWTLSGSAGAYNPPTAAFPGGAPEGNNTAFSNGPTITQTVSTAVTGTLYTLNVLVGDRADIPPVFFPGYTVALQINGSTVASASSPTPAKGEFTLVTVQYTASGPDDGQPLGILLDSIGIQTNFDLVMLDAAAPPVFTKTFAPSLVTVFAKSTLTFTIDNTANVVAATSLDFTDTLPTGLVVASPSNASTTCTGGTLTAISGSGDISYTGGTVPAGASCSVGADVTANEVGDLVNVSGDLTSSAGNSRQASSTLNVTALSSRPIPTLSWPALLALILLILGTHIVNIKKATHK